MILFWSLIAAMVLAALAFILPPLLRRHADDDRPARDELNVAIHRQRLAELDADLASGALTRAQYDEARRELEAEVLQDVTGSASTRAGAERPTGRWAAAVIAAIVVALSIGLYLELGASRLIPILQTADRAPAEGATPGGVPPRVEEMVARLETKLQADPGNARGWRMLGRSYLVLERFAEAGRAYARAYELRGDDPELMVEYAQALALAKGGDMSGRPEQLVRQVLAQNPDHAMALWLAGYAAFQQADYRQAVARWERLIEKHPEESKEAQVVQRLLQEARSRLSEASPAKPGG